MEATVDSILKCMVCLAKYDTSTHKPMLLPKCGHTFCNFCLDVLHKQSKTSCPECRKENAVTSVTSLPVNFSLLTLVQPKSHDDTKSSEQRNSPRLQNPSAPQGTSLRAQGQGRDSVSRPSFSVRPKIPINHMVSRQQVGFSNPPRQSNIMKQSSSVYSGQELGRSSGNSVSSSVLDDHAEALRLQEELDFQMAIHLTFCKDKSHGHDDPISAQCCWQFPADEELSKAITHTF